MTRITLQITPAHPAPIRWDTGIQGETRTLPLTWRLVILRDHATGKMAEYIRLYLPDQAYADRWPEAHYKEMKAFNRHHDFTGYVIYATLNGFPISAQRCQAGQERYGATLLNTDCSMEQNLQRLDEMLVDVYVQQHAIIQTRATLDPVICIGLSGNDFRCAVAVILPSMSEIGMPGYTENEFRGRSPYSTMFICATTTWGK